MISVAHSARPRRPRGLPIPEGTTFDRLTVESGPYVLYPKRDGSYHYQCRCSCGRILQVRATNLYMGAKSCGCGRLDAMTRHGESRSRLYRTWERIIQRCHNPNSNVFSDYGGRGIIVCDEWRADYTAFRDWALANGHADGLEIDRWPDNNGPYAPDNCRWATRAEQLRNTRSNSNHTAFGETKCMVDWVADPRCVVSSHCLRYRLKNGWDFPTALTTPPLLRGQRYSDFLDS